MRVAPAVYLVGSGVQGCSMTNELDCNCWLVDCGGALILFDTGAGIDASRIVQSIEADGLRPSALSHIFLTHGHADHSGGAEALKSVSRAVVCCGLATSEAIGRGPAGISLDAAMRAGMYPPGYRYRTTIPDVIVAPRTVLEFGHVRVEPVATPGHSLDHMSYLVRVAGRSALISGDALFHSGRIVYQATPDFDARLSCDSIRALAAMDFDMLLPGHGLFVLNGAKRHAGAAVASLDAMRLPAPVDFAKL